MRLRIYKFTVIGFFSGFISWAPFLFIQDGLSGWLRGFIVLMPAIIFACVLLITLKKDSRVFKFSPPITLTIIILASVLSWICALITSTVGTDFNLSGIGQEFYVLTMAGLLPSYIGVFVSGLGVKLILAKPGIDFSRFLIFVIFSASSAIVIFSLLSVNLLPFLTRFLSVITGIASFRFNEMCNLLLLFLVWQIVFFASLSTLTSTQTLINKLK